MLIPVTKFESGIYVHTFMLLLTGCSSFLSSAAASCDVGSCSLPSAVTSTVAVVVVVGSVAASV